MLLKKYLNKIGRYIFLLSILHKPKILVIGDSHVAVFKYINRHYNLPFYFNVKNVPGATSLGIANPNSKTNALKLFKARLDKVRTSIPILIQMGEVDCGYVIWFVADKKNQSPEIQYQRSIINYQNFLKTELIDRGFIDIVVMSAALPTLKDNIHEAGDVAFQRREVTVSQKLRTELTLRYNQDMKEFCTKNNIRFLDLDDNLLGEDKLIKSVFLNSNPFDHHIDSDKYSKLIINELKKNDIYF